MTATVAGPAWRRALLGATWVVVLVVVLLGLHRLGAGPLSTPPLLDRSALRLWLDDRDVLVAVFALVRLVALTLAWYLLAVTAVGLAARSSRIATLVRLADRATLPAVRRLLGTVAGIGITASAASLMATDLVPGAHPPGGPPGGPAESAVVLQRLPGSDDVTLRRLPPGTEDDDGSATLRVDDGADDGTTDDTAGAAPAPAPEWVAAPGDHLWHIAEAVLADAWSRPPTDAEVAPYWRSLVEANRDRLVDPDDPDLILPGQTFRLPPAPPPRPDAGR